MVWAAPIVLDEMHSAGELLEAVQAFGVPIYRLESESDVSEAWADWWQTLPLPL